MTNSYPEQESGDQGGGGCPPTPAALGGRRDTAGLPRGHGGGWEKSAGLGNSVSL